MSQHQDPQPDTPAKKSRLLRSGFTLIEILMSVLIMAILAGLAIPNLSKTIETSRSSEATGNLQQIYQGQAIYKLNNGSYWNGGPNPLVADVNATLKTSLKTEYYTLTDITGSAAAFSAQEDRDGCPGKFFTVDQTGTITENGSYC